MRDPGNPSARRTGNRRRAMSRARHTPECEKIWAEFIRDHPLCQFHLDILFKKMEKIAFNGFFSQRQAVDIIDRARALSNDPKALKDFIYLHFKLYAPELDKLVVPTKNPHHPYLTKASEYCTPEVIAKCTPTCTRCHRAVHVGKVLCPVCGLNYAPWDADPLMCRPCFDKTHPEIVKAREQHARDWKETQKRIRQESQEKFRMNRAKEIIKIQLYACNRPRRTINQETATVFVWIKNSGKNPLTVKRRTLERMTEEWVRKWRS